MMMKKSGSRINHSVALISLREEGVFLGSRYLGARLRSRAETELATVERLMVDFQGVEMVTHSFADEFAGKLAGALGPQQFQERVRFANVDEDVKPILRYAIQERFQMGLNEASGTLPKTTDEDDDTRQ